MTSKLFVPPLVTIRAIIHVIYMIAMSGLLCTLVEEISKITNWQRIPKLLRGVPEIERSVYRFVGVNVVMICAMIHQFIIQPTIVQLYQFLRGTATDATFVLPCSVQ
jgi:hypothetical protein